MKKVIESDSEYAALASEYREIGPKLLEAIKGAVTEINSLQTEGGFCGQAADALYSLNAQIQSCLVQPGEGEEIGSIMTDHADKGESFAGEIAAADVYPFSHAVRNPMGASVVVKNDPNKRIFSDEKLMSIDNFIDGMIVNLQSEVAEQNVAVDSYASRFAVDSFGLDGPARELYDLQFQAKPKVHKMYEDVERIDITYKDTIEALGFKTSLYQNRIDALTGCLRPDDGSGQYYPPEIILAAVGDLENVTFALDVQSMYDYYYNDPRKWRDYLSQNADAISEEGYCMLSIIYMQGTDEDVAGIIEGLPEAGFPSYSVPFTNQSVTFYDINQEKLSRIQGYVKARLAQLQNDYDILNTTPELKVVKREEVARIQTEKFQLQQRNALLTAVGHLEQFNEGRTFPQDAVINDANLQDQLLTHALTNDMCMVADKDAPAGSPISIAKINGYYSIVYQDTSWFVIPGQMQDITVEPTATKVSSITNAGELINAYIDPSFSLLDSAATAGGGYAQKKLSAYAWSKVQKTLEGDAAQQQKYGVKLHGYCRDVGNIVLGLLEDDYDHNVKEQEAAGIKQIITNADICNRFGFESNTVKVNGSESKSDLLISKGTETDMRVHNYNLWVEWKLSQPETTADEKAVITSMGNGGVITERDAINNPQALGTIWSGEAIQDTTITKGAYIMDQQEERLVFESSHRPLTVEDLEQFEENREAKLYDLSVEAYK